MMKNYPLHCKRLSSRTFFVAPSCQADRHRLHPATVPCLLLGVSNIYIWVLLGLLVPGWCHAECVLGLVFRLISLHLQCGCCVWDVRHLKRTETERRSLSLRNCQLNSLSPECWSQIPRSRSRTSLCQPVKESVQGVFPAAVGQCILRCWRSAGLRQLKF
jgi:hypothetical protein